MAKRRKTQQQPKALDGPRGTGFERGLGFEGGIDSYLITLAFLLFLAIYLVLFYRLEVVPGVFRYERLAFAVLPDQLIDEWCGGEIGRVQVLDRIGPVAAVGVMAFVAGLMGYCVLDVLRVERHLDRLERCAFGMGIGLSGLSLFSLIVGLMGGLDQPWWFMVLGFVLLGIVAWRVWQSGVYDRARCRATELADEAPAPIQGTAWWHLRWWWAAIPFAAVIVAGGVLPSLAFDVLEYHLQVPKEWYLQGHVSFLPHNVYGNMPLGGEMLATQAMALIPGEDSWWRGALAGKLAMACYSLLTTFLVFLAGRRFFSQRAGVIAALLYISTAWVADVSLNGLNEGVVAFYLLASFYTGKVWWDVRRAGDTSSWGLLFLTGLLAGAAVSCKYTSVLMVVFPLLVVVGVGSRTQRGRALVFFLIAVTAACGLWFGKNWALTGNPTYPLLVQVFGGETRTPEKDAQWRRAHQVPRDEDGNRYSLAQAKQATLDVLGGSSWQNPLMVPFAALLLVRWKRNGDVVYWLMLLAFVLLAWWLVTHRLSRFWVPAIPLMALLAGVGATWSTSLVWRRTVTAVLTVGLVANFLFIVAPLPKLADDRYFVSLEQLRDDPQMTIDTGARRPIAFRYLRDHVPDGSHVLSVGDAAVFDLQVPVLYNTCFDDCRFEQMIRDSDLQQRRANLESQQVSHIYIDWVWLARYREPGNYGYSPYVTRALVHDELVGRQGLLRPVVVEGLDPALAEIFEVSR